MCAFLHFLQNICSLHRSFCPLCNNCLLWPGPWLSSQLSDRQPTWRWDQKRRRRRSWWLEWDVLSSCLCHAGTHSNASFSPHTREGVSTKRGLCELSVSVSSFHFCCNWFNPDWNTDQDQLNYVLRFYIHVPPRFYVKENDFFFSA